MKLVSWLNWNMGFHFCYLFAKFEMEVFIEHEIQFYEINQKLNFWKSCLRHRLLIALWNLITSKRKGGRIQSTLLWKWMEFIFRFILWRIIAYEHTIWTIFSAMMVLEICVIYLTSNKILLVVFIFCFTEWFWSLYNAVNINLLFQFTFYQAFPEKFSIITWIPIYLLWLLASFVISM